eukprot:SM000029S10495  [mRNA]  locus=s29:484483:485811:- [translate_table: standard]
MASAGASATPPAEERLLYHERQEAALCAVHCLNALLQGPFFTEVDLAALAAELDARERAVMAEGHGGGTGNDGDSGEAGGGGGAAPAGLAAQETGNVAASGNFSIQVLSKALEVWSLQCVPLDAPGAGQARLEPQREEAFLCHLHAHWFTVRKVSGEWFNFNSLYAAPERLSPFYLSAYLSTLKSSGWSIFVIRGSLPDRHAADAYDLPSGSRGQWVTAQEAVQILAMAHASGNSMAADSSLAALSMEQQQLVQELATTFRTTGREQAHSIEVDDDDRELMAAIAASMKDQDPSAS